MESYSITNIKAFKNRTEVPIKPITIFVGKNSCGKSSLMRFPVVLSQTVSSETTGPLKFYGKLIDYGYYEDVVFNQSTDPIEFSVSYKIDISETRFKDSDEDTRDIRLAEMRVSLSKQDKRVVIEKNELLIDGLLCYGLYRNSSGVYKTKVYKVYDQSTHTLIDKTYEITIKDCHSQQFFVEVVSDSISKAVIEKYMGNGINEFEKLLTETNDRFPLDFLFDESFRKFYFKDNKPEIFETDSFKTYIEIGSVYYYYENLLEYIYRVLSYEVNHLSYIGPFRKNPERIYRDEEFRTRRVGVKGENVSTVLIRDYQKNQELVSKISEWLQKTMGYKLVVEEISNGLFRLMLEDVNGIKSNIIDVGYGISQILPIIAQILVGSSSRNMYGEDRGNLVIVEQPELHLHPAAQSELADLFVSGAIEGKKQMLIETHSEHFIRKLQILIADPNCKISSSDVAVYYVDKGVDGSASLREMEILPNGKFKEKWPAGFFDKAFELSMELLRTSKG